MDYRMGVCGGGSLGGRRTELQAMRKAGDRDLSTLGARLLLLPFYSDLHRGRPIGPCGGICEYYGYKCA